MSKFLTIDELVDRSSLEEITDVAGIGSYNDSEGRSLDEVKIYGALEFADELVISHCRQRYPTLESLTPETTPGMIKGFVSDITRYRLRTGRGGVSEELLQRYRDAMAFLLNVSSGRAELPLAGQPINGDAHGRVSAIMPVSRIDQMLAGYR